MNNYINRNICYTIVSKYSIILLLEKLLLEGAFIRLNKKKKKSFKTQEDGSGTIDTWNLFLNPPPRHFENTSRTSVEQVPH